MKRLFPLAAAILLIGSALSASAQSRKVDAHWQSDVDAGKKTGHLDKK